MSVITPNFVAVGQTMYEKSVTKNLLRQSKLNIPTILPCGGIKRTTKVNVVMSRSTLTFIGHCRHVARTSQRRLHAALFYDCQRALWVS